MEHNLKLVTVVLLGLLVTACGGGNSSTGGGTSIQGPIALDPPEPTVISGEFALDCMAMIQVRRNGTALVQNICDYSINVAQMDSRFPGPPPVTEIPPGQLVAVQLADDTLSIGLGACRAPSIPTPSPDRPGFFFCPDVQIEQGKDLTRARSGGVMRSLRVAR